MSFDPSALNNLLLIAAAWGGAFLAALWLSLLVWTYRDIRSRVRDPLVRILAVLVVALLFLPGVVVYLSCVHPRRWRMSISICWRKRLYYKLSRKGMPARVAGGTLRMIGRYAQTAIPA